MLSQLKHDFHNLRVHLASQNQAVAFLWHALDPPSLPRLLGKLRWAICPLFWLFFLSFCGGQEADLVLLKRTLIYIVQGCEEADGDGDKA